MGAGYVFISYSRIDSSFVGELADHLAAHQIPTWFDRRISPGEYWSREIEAAIDSCSAFIMVMSRSARASRWVALELNHSASRNKKIIPLLLNGEVFFELNTIEYEDVSDGSMPTPRTMSLLKVLTDEGAPLAPMIRPTPMLPSPPFASKVWHVPPRNSLFTGREEILRAIGHHRRAAVGSITALCGPGGVGKSSIAVEYAYSQSAEFELVWWMDAGPSSSVHEQLAAMAHSLGLVEDFTELSSAAARTRNYLRRHGNWLIAMEDASNADKVLGMLPYGTGQILITSRDSRFHEIGTVIDVRTFSRQESVAFLKAQLPVLSDTEADALAAAVGDLPLAAAQAGGFMRETGASAGEYLDALEGHASDLLQLGRPANYPRSVATVIARSVDELRNIDPLALKMLKLCAFLAPEPIPVAWMLQAPSGTFSDALNASAPRKIQLRASVGQLVRLGLARLVDVDSAFVIHRITRAVVRDLLGAADRDVLHETVLRLLLTAQLDDLSNVENWALSAAIAAHIRYLGQVNADDAHYVNSQEFRTLLLDVARYLEVSGQGDLAQTLAGHAYTSWSRRLASALR
ncbi:FxSxx-COOH system tetratricopeptide repeat protein [Actinoplanes sp. NBC_00393]|uniref:FxSxx-COOH system tetratricopeptide repeat protein n=1 Tax=Actinoplanes sp. NBC_00393 TaxID=2975953 RepID=UPI002E1E2A64